MSNVFYRDITPGQVMIATRKRSGLPDRVGIVLVGTTTRYQHIADYVLFNDGTIKWWPAHKLEHVCHLLATEESEG